MYYSAFLHGHLDEEVYMTTPSVFSAENSDKVCRLIKSLYGLKQESRLCIIKLTFALLAQDFRQASVDPFLFIKHQGDSMLMISFWPAMIRLRFSLKPSLHDQIKDLGFLKFLGLEAA